MAIQSGLDGGRHDLLIDGQRFRGFPGRDDMGNNLVAAFFQLGCQSVQIQRSDRTVADHKQRTSDRKSGLPT
ncbi:hypothetical protein D3C72_2279040 [compost metagenome]